MNNNILVLVPLPLFSYSLSSSLSSSLFSLLSSLSLFSTSYSSQSRFPASYQIPGSICQGIVKSSTLCSL